jgi:hypothetical protein
LADEAVSITMTPDPCAVMCRAAAVAVRKLVRQIPVTGAMKSSSEIRVSGMFCTTLTATALNETSILPAA